MASEGFDRIAQIEAHVAARVKEAFETVGAADASVVLQRPPRAEMGEFAVPCFPLAAVLRQSPAAIAAQVANAIAPSEMIAGADADGGFVNLRLSTEPLARTVVGDALDSADQLLGFASGYAAERHRFLLEFSSPNTNKPLHLGHVRNNVLGLAVSRMLSHAGHDVHTVSLVNDRGVHICKTMLAYMLWADGGTPESKGAKGDHFIGDLYVLFSSRFASEYEEWLQTANGVAQFEQWRTEKTKRLSERKEKKKGKAKAPDLSRKAFAKSFEDTYFNKLSELGGQTRDLLRRWEDEDEEVRALWAKMNQWVLDGFEVTYQRMGVQFDSVDYESNTYLHGRAVVETGLADGHFHRLDDGAFVCNYEALGIGSVKTPHKILLRGDGTTVYTTQDLGTALTRHQQIGFDRLVYVVADEQKHHFKVLFALLGLLEPELADVCHHLAYGMVNLPEGRMKSREGTVVDADDLFDEMAALAANELRARAKGGRAHAVRDDDDVEIVRRAEVIAQAAIKFYLLGVTAESGMTFDPKKSIDFLGRTGPYCLNAYARTRQLLAKADASATRDREPLARLVSDRERAVVRALMLMPPEFARALDSFDPSKVALATYEVARAFNQLYTDKDNHPIVSCDDPELRAARLSMVGAVGIAIRTGLYVLGIEVLEQM